jgi:hypothetical protein
MCQYCEFLAALCAVEGCWAGGWLDVGCPAFERCSTMVQCNSQIVEDRCATLPSTDGSVFVSPQRQRGIPFPDTYDEAAVEELRERGVV